MLSVVIACADDMLCPFARMTSSADARGILDGDIVSRDHPLRRSDQPHVTVWAMADKAIEVLRGAAPMAAVA